MDANDNLKTRKHARTRAIAMVVSGATYISIYMIPIVDSFFAHKFDPLLAGHDTPINLPSILAAIYSRPFDMEKLIFVLGCIMSLIGLLSLLSLLIDRLTNGKVFDHVMSYPYLASFWDAFMICDMNAYKNLEKKRKYARAIAIVEIGAVILDIGVIPSIFIPVILFKPNIPDIIIGIMILYIFIAEPLFVSGLILLLIGLLSFFVLLLVDRHIDLIGRLKKSARKANDLERETNALMRDPKQTGQSQSQESHPSRRTVIVGLIATGGVAAGGGAIWWVLTPHPLYVYRGHSISVNAVAWSPNSKRIASASYDKTVQVWDAVDGSHVFTYKRHSDTVQAIAWSPDGKRIASGSFDKTVQVWDAVDGRHVFTYKGHFDWVNAVAWSLDGKRIASGSWGGTVQVWDAMDGGHVYTYKGHSDYSVYAVAWSPDGKRIASGSFDKTVQVWDAVDGSHVFTYRGSSSPADAVAWSPNGKRIASSGSEDGTVQVWDAEDGGHVFTYKGHSSIVNAVAWSPNGKRIASGSYDNTVQVWDAVDGDHVFTYKGHSDWGTVVWVKAVAWSSDGKRIAFGSAGMYSQSDDYTVQVWEAP